MRNETQPRVGISTQSGVAVMTLSRPETLNALSRALTDELDANLLRLAADERVRVVVLQADGKHFCAGADIADMSTMTYDEATRTDYTNAMNSYDRAKAELETIRRADEIQRVTNALEDGRYYMTATRARLAGDPVPERRAPCFFNPQHGPSVRDVDWAPPGGTPRSVPVCRACASTSPCRANSISSSAPDDTCAAARSGWPLSSRTRAKPRFSTSR